MTSESQNNFVLPLISKLYLNMDLADVHFVFKNDDEKVPANKTILAAGSPVFRAMFYGDLKEKDKVEIADATADGFKEFLQFFYLSKVTLTMENMEEVARLADKYDIFECLNNYATTLIDGLTMDNMCWGYQLAVIIKHKELKAYCEKNICAFTEDLLKSNTFLHCDQKILKHILEIETLMYDETEIFGACLEWAKFACDRNVIDENEPKNLREQLGDCFNLIRFNAMTHEEFVKHTVAYEEVFTRDELAHILYKTTSKFTPNKFNQIPRLKTFLQWDNTQMLDCSQVISTSNPVYYIKNSESVWFSTSVPVVLGEIYCVPIRNGNGYNISLNYNITVVEINAQSFEVSASTKIVFKGTVLVSGDKEIKVALCQPFAINPKKMYEIRLDSSTNTSGYYCYALPWKSDVKLDEKVTVTFHTNPSTNEQRGLISRLCFNQF